MKPIFYFSIITLLLTVFSCGEKPATGQEQVTTDKSDPRQIRLLTSRHYPADDTIFQRLTANQGYKVDVIEREPAALLTALEEENRVDVVVFPDLTYAPQAMQTEQFRFHGLPGLDSYYKSDLRDESGFWTGLTRRYPVIAFKKEAAGDKVFDSYAALGDKRWQGKLLLPPADDAALLTVVTALYVQQGEAAVTEWVKKVLANGTEKVIAGSTARLQALADGDAEVTIAMLDDYAYLRQPATHAEFLQSQALSVVLPEDEDGESYYTVSFAAMPAQADPRKTKVLVEFLCNQYAQGRYPAAAFEYPANLMTLPESTLLDYMGGVKDDDMGLEVMVQYLPIAQQLLRDAQWPES